MPTMVGFPRPQPPPQQPQPQPEPKREPHTWIWKSQQYQAGLSRRQVGRKADDQKREEQKIAPPEAPLDPFSFLLQLLQQMIPKF